MDEKAWRRVQGILAELLEATAEEREARLRGEDAEIRAEVESILAAHDATTSSDETGAILPTPGTTIDRYLILRELGMGGFGVVFLAEQIEPVRRQVALKVLKVGMDTAQVVARFQAEQQALALMDHPGIAKVLDGGATEAGRPYFVMEYVDGEAITDYCDERRLNTAQRLELFTEVCQAVHHAHQKGIIHRDIKPSNVLVATVDGRPVPKVIDFGVARAMDQRLTERTVFTQMGQILGTPEYMSPEQAGGAKDIDTRADVYSLGVLLYELLTGSKPFDLQSLLQRGLSEILRTIREVDPPRPSTRISTMGDLLPDVAAKRRTPARLLGRVVRGDLDWIVMKALEKNRDRRYDSVSAFAMDVQNYLSDNPVSAGPPSRMYRLRKYLRRHRVGVAAAGVVAVALVVGLVGALVGLAEARRQTEVALDEADKAGRTLGILQDMLASADPHQVPDPNYTVRRMLDDFEPELTPRLAGQPEVEAAIRSTLGNTYLGLGVPDQAEMHLRRSLDLREQVYADDHLEVAAGLDDWAAVLYMRGRYVDAIRDGRRALAIHVRELGPEHDTVAQTRSNLSVYLMGLGDYRESETQARQALAVRLGNQGDDARDTAHSRNNLAAIVKAQGRLTEAETLFQQALATYRALSPEGHPDTARTLQNLATLLSIKGKTHDAEDRFEEAIEMGSRVMGKDHPGVALAMSNLAGDLASRGGQVALQRAAELLDGALAMQREAYGDVHPNIAMTLKRQASLRQAQRRFEDAEGLFEQALAMQTLLLGAEHRAVAGTHLALGALYVSQRNFRRAEDEYTRGRLLLEAVFGEESVFVANADSLRAGMRRLQGKPKQSEELARKVLQIRLAAFGEGSILVAADQYVLALALRQQGLLPEAREYLQKSLDTRMRELGEEHPATVETRNTLSLLMVQMREFEEAEPLLRERIEVAKRVWGEEDGRIPRFQQRHAAVLMYLHRLEEAETVSRQAVKLNKERNGPRDADTVGMLLTLAQIRTRRGDYVEAERFNREALELRKSISPKGHRQTAVARMRLGISLANQARFEEAKPLLHWAVIEARRAFTEKHRGFPPYLDALANTCVSLNRLEEAEELLRESLNLHATHRPGQDLPTANPTLILAQVRGFQGRFEEALDLSERGGGIVGAHLKASDPQLQAVRQSRADLLAEWGKLADAETIYRDVLEKRRALLEAGHPAIARTLWGLGRVLFEQERYAEAEPFLEEILNGTSQIAWARYDAMSLLGGCLLGRGRPEAAKPHCLEGYAEMEPPPVRKHRKREALGRLVAVYKALGDEAEAKRWRAVLEGSE